MAPNEAIERLVEKQFDAHNSRDWDVYRSTTSDDYEFVDHRPAGFGTIIGKEGFLEFLKSAIELVPDRRLTLTEWFPDADARVDATDVSVVAARVLGDGTDEYGSRVNWEFIGVWQCRQGQVVRLEIFDPLSVDEAVGRAQALSSGGVT